MRYISLLLMLPALLVGYAVGTLQAGAPSAVRGSELALSDGPLRGAGAALEEDPEQADMLAAANREQPPIPGSETSGPETSERAPVDLTAGASGELEATSFPALEAGNLRERLAEYLASDIIAARYSENPQGLAHFLINEHINGGDVWTAWEILNEHPLGPAVYAQVGTQLKSSGHRAEAREALLHALRSDPMNTNWAQQLADLDPAGALAILDEQINTRPELADSPLPLQTVRLLLANEQSDEAQRRLEMLIAAGATGDDVWALVTQMGDEFAQRHLREAMADRGDQASIMRLARYLAEHGGDPDEIASLSHQILEQNPGSRKALDMLAGIDPELALRALDRSLERDPNNDALWGRMADQLIASGDTAGAVDAWLRAYDADPSETNYLWNLREHAPEQFWPAIETAARERDYDELWGDVADAYWEEGRHMEAQTAWERARDLDPDDGEWIGKLRAIGEDNDPLGNIQWGWGGSESDWSDSWLSPTDTHWFTGQNDLLNNGTGWIDPGHEFVIGGDW